jgi:glycerophosphoryl diester phosphodiesterase
MPSSPSREAELRRLIARPFAHRGLHGPGRIENSRAAFEAAIAAGHGIELDVQASADGEAMVFHDYDLARLAQNEGKVAELGAADLTA